MHTTSATRGPALQPDFAADLQLGETGEDIVARLRAALGEGTVHIHACDRHGRFFNQTQRAVDVTGTLAPVASATNPDTVHCVSSPRHQAALFVSAGQLTTLRTHTPHQPYTQQGLGPTLARGKTFRFAEVVDGVHSWPTHSVDTAALPPVDVLRPRNARFDLHALTGGSPELTDDTLQLFANGPVEVKWDARWCDTGRLYIETDCRYRGTQWGPSGLSVTTAAAWAFVLGHPTPAGVLVLPTHLLRRRAATGIDPRKSCDRGSHPTKGFAVPTAGLFTP